MKGISVNQAQPEPMLHASSRSEHAQTKTIHNTYVLFDTELCRSPHATAEVDRDILPVEVYKRALRVAGDFRIAEVRVGGAERVPLRSSGENEILNTRHRRNIQGGRTTKKRKKTRSRAIISCKSAETR